MNFNVEFEKNNKTHINLWNISVVAGHFSWGIWNSLPSYQHHHLQHQPQPNKTSDTDSQRNSNRDNLSDNISFDSSASDSPTVPSVSLPPPSCFVMGRHPISRAISYYYERCYQISDCSGYNIRLNDMPLHEVESLLIYLRKGALHSDNTTAMILDEGLEDAACRAIANEKVTTGIILKSTTTALPKAQQISIFAKEQAMKNIKLCVVGIQEKWKETVQIIKFWYPWIKIEEEKKKMKLYSNTETIDTIRDDIKELILKYNTCDMQLYELMLLQFEKQMQVLTDASFL